MKLETFDHIEAGVSYRYEIGQDALVYTETPSTGQVAKKRLEISWNELSGLRPTEDSLAFSYTKQSPNGKPTRSWLPLSGNPDQIAILLRSIFTAWGQASRGTAAKAAFDYGDSRKGVSWMWIAASLVFPGMLAVLLLLDGVHTLRCNELLPNGTVTQAEVVKSKKGRRGAIEWTLQFRLPDGSTIKGKRAVLAPVALGRAADAPSAPQVASVAYSPENPGCWDLSLASDRVVLNHNQRRFSQVMSLGFGVAFALTTLIGIAIGVLKLRARRPYRETVASIAAELTSKQG